MDWIADLFPILIFIFWVLSQLGRKKKPAPEGELLLNPEQEERAPSPFEQLILQIQEAAAAQNQPEPVLEPVEATKPAQPSLTRLQAVRPVEFKGVGTFDHERHGFGDENPFSEEAFERLPAGQDIVEHAPGHLDYSPHSSLRPSEQQTRSRRSEHPLARRLRKPGSALVAFGLKEILDAPRSKRRRIR